jgi:hypothetical protein
MTIEYEGLTKDFRRGLWRTFLSKARTLQGPAVVEEEDIQRLESLALNGLEVFGLWTKRFSRGLCGSLLSNLHTQ